MIHETYRVDATTSFGIDIAPAPADGRKYPVVVLVHGNFGLRDPYGDQLRNFTDEIAELGYLAALPTYFPSGFANPEDVNIDAHSPALVAAIDHLSRRADADVTRLGLVGFSLGGGIALSYIQRASIGSVKAFADFYGLVGPKLSAGVAKVPPTIIFSNEHDPFVPVAQNSGPFADALARAHIEHEPIAPYAWAHDDWIGGGVHAFRPGGPDDVSSRDRTKKWLVKHMPPVGLP
ncbi:dienelactone hydrolase family protein [Paludisphaera rhizosphaerae]|uniref:dienelactone hydrolase family protein n=1 Tax=Paludisphaera rhizosphaerae TaxID=2711216 RepID=UPI0013EDB00C|nr:dienelactone hydrolase family protein [Paludisphaera rhizosphaerae]